MKNFSRQKNIYYGFNFINRFMVYMPVFVLFLKMKGLNQTHVMVMMSAYNIAIMVGEIPTGILADRISRKASVMLGCIIQGGGYALYVASFKFLYISFHRNFVWDWYDHAIRCYVSYVL